MQNLILKGLQQKLQKSWTLGTSNQAIYPPKYLLLFVYRLRYINDNITKDRCPIPIDTTVRLGPLKFSLRATIDHHGPSIYSGHYTAAINCCKKHSIVTITQLRSLELLIKTPLLHMLYYMSWLTHDLFGLEQEGGSLIAPMVLAHPLRTIDNKSRNKRRNLWVGWCVSSWWPCFPSRSSVLIYIYIYICICIPYMSSVIGRIYIYNGSVIQYWRSCTPSRFIGLYFWGVRGSWDECHFLFSLVYQLCLAPR